MRLTEESAARIAVLYYLAMVTATFCVAWVIHWMGRTYGASQPLGQCYALASYTATSLFLVGLMHLQPILWLNLLVGLPVLGYTVFIFYTGVPAMMEIPPERGFLFSSAVMAFGLVALVALLVMSVLLWTVGIRSELHELIPREAPRTTHRHARDLQLHRGAPVRGDDHRVGDRGHAGRGGHRGAARVAGAQLRHPLAHLRPAPPAPYQRV